MKKLLLPIFFLFFALNLNAQYSYSYFSAPYANLVNPDTLNINVPDWDDDYWTHEIGFPVNSFGTWYDSVVVESNGSLILYNTLDSANFFYQTDTLPALMGFGEFISTYGTGDLVYRYSGTSPISYELTGAPGARIAKFEWKDCGFYNDTTATYTNFINFQIWLYEITGDVEYRFGTSFVEAFSYDGNIGPVIGIAPYIADPDYDFFAGIFLRGDSTACTSVPTYDTTRGTPVPNAVHRFANLSTVGIKENLAQGFVMYPNPANENVNLIVPEGKQVITLSDVAGRICVREESNNGGNISISLHGLQAGVYFITVSNEKTTSTQRLIVR
jgi:hypothetical protein